MIYVCAAIFPAVEALKGSTHRGSWQGGKLVWVVRIDLSSRYEGEISLFLQILKWNF